jgi:hypothetical protein
MIRSLEQEIHGEPTDALRGDLAWTEEGKHEFDRCGTSIF